MMPVWEMEVTLRKGFTGVNVAKKENEDDVSASRPSECYAGKNRIMCAATAGGQLQRTFDLPDARKGDGGVGSRRRLAEAGGNTR